MERADRPQGAPAPDPFSGPEDDPALKITQGLAKLGLLLRHEQWVFGTPLGLTATQVQMLAALAAHGGSVRPGRLAGELAVRAPTVTESVQVLQARGYVRRSRDPGDGRGVRIVLTRRGWKVAERCLAWPELLARTVAALTPAEQGVLLRAVVKMIRLLQDEGRIPVARMCVTCTFFRPHVHSDPERPHHCAYVDAPFGDRQLRLDCADHVVADEPARHALWTRFTALQPERR